MKVFVYGTLRKGYGNHRLIEDAELIGEATLHGYRMHSLGAFPAITKDEEHSVVGEVYSINQDQLQSMDWLEGVPTLYQRARVTTTQGEAWAYTMTANAVRDLPRIDSGDWNQRHDVV